MYVYCRRALTNTDEGDWNESSPRVHLGYYTMFTRGEQKHQQKIVNNGRHRKSEDCISARNYAVTGAKTVQTIPHSAAKEDVSTAKMCDGGRRFLLQKLLFYNRCRSDCISHGLPGIEDRMLSRCLVKFMNF